MPLVNVSKAGRSILVDADTDHHKKLIDDGYQPAEVPAAATVTGQGSIPSAIRPALPHPSHPYALNTSGSPAEAAVAESERVALEKDRAVAKTTAAAKANADAAQDHADTVKVAADTAQANADAHADAKQKNDRARKSKDDGKTAAPPTVPVAETK